MEINPNKQFRWGLEYAMLSHFCADIVLHVIAIGR